MTKRNINQRDLSFVLAISLFSFFVTSYLFLLKNGLYWDAKLGFSIFRDNLHSLNKFGDFAWWYPHRQLGWAAYYHSFLGQLTSGSPTMVLLGVYSWVIGQLGIEIGSYFHLWVFHTSFLIPTFLNACVFLLARQLFPSLRVAYFAVILSAFSPGVVVGLSDPGFLEPAVYSVFFATAFIQFLSRPSRFSFYLLTLGTCLLAVMIGFPFMFWAFFGVPLFLISVLATNGNFTRFIGGLKQIDRSHLFVCGIAIVLCAIPNFIVFAQAGDLVRTRTGTKIYDFDFLSMGNPLEFFSISWPGFGFDLEASGWKLLPPGNKHHGLTYLGLLSLPLSVMGLLHGRRRIRSALAILITSAFGIVVLSAYSPFFSLILAWPTPLRAVNHFGDAFFRAGGFLIPLFMACAGLDALLRSSKARQHIKYVFLVWMLVSTQVIMGMLGSEAGINASVGLFALLSFAFGTLLFWLGNTKQSKKIKSLVLAILLLCLLDVATVVNLHVRGMIVRPQFVTIDETPAEDGIGMKQTINGEFSLFIIATKQMIEMVQKQFDFSTLPSIDFFSVVRESTSLEEDSQFFNTKHILSIDRDSYNSDSFSKFGTYPQNGPTNTNPLEIGASAEVLKRSYNSFELKVFSPKASVLFLKDTFSPYWIATSGDLKFPIARAFRNFKAVAISEGQTIIRFDFKPPGVALSYWTAYLTMLGLLAATWRFYRAPVPRMKE